MEKQNQIQGRPATLNSRTSEERKRGTPNVDRNMLLQEYNRLIVKKEQNQKVPYTQTISELKAAVLNQKDIITQLTVRLRRAQQHRSGKQPNRSQGRTNMDPEIMLAIQMSLQEGQQMDPELLQALRMSQTEPDLDSMSYEDILELGERIGTVSSGLTEEELNRNPTYQVTTPEYCTICQFDLNEGEMARRLINCGHVYHIECIDEWLNAKKSCPICLVEVV